MLKENSELLIRQVIQKTQQGLFRKQKAYDLPVFRFEFHC